jgi:RimJ/RimL family protein N-acetyltransferase
MKLETPRLVLRRWRDSDREPFSAMNADEEVMQFFSSKLTVEQSNLLVDKIEKQFVDKDFGLFAVERKQDKSFIGFVGLNQPTFESSFTPCVEIGWRVARPFWGLGYAPEAAKEVLRDGFERLGLNEILSMTAAINLKSIRVMQKIGMHIDLRDNFLHPLVADDSPLKPHVLFRLRNEEYRLDDYLSGEKST